MSNISDRKSNIGDVTDVSVEIREMIANRDNVLQRVMNEAAVLTEEDYATLEMLSNKKDC